MRFGRAWRVHKRVPIGLHSSSSRKLACRRSCLPPFHSSRVGVPAAEAVPGSSEATGHSGGWHGPTGGKTVTTPVSLITLLAHICCPGLLPRPTPRAAGACWAPCQPCGRPRVKSRHLAAAWLSPGRSELVDGRSCFSFCLSNVLKCFQIKEKRQREKPQFRTIPRHLVWPWRITQSMARATAPTSANLPTPPLLPQLQALILAAPASTGHHLLRFPAAPAGETGWEGQGLSLQLRPAAPHPSAGSLVHLPAGRRKRPAHGHASLEQAEGGAEPQPPLHPRRAGPGSASHSWSLKQGGSGLRWQTLGLTPRGRPFCL